MLRRMSPEVAQLGSADRRLGGSGY